MRPMVRLFSRRVFLIFILLFLLGYFSRSILSVLRHALSALSSTLHHLSSLAYTASSILLALVTKSVMVPALFLQGGLSWTAHAMKKLAALLFHIMTAVALWLATAAYHFLKHAGPKIGRAAYNGSAATAEWVQRIVAGIAGGLWHRRE